MSEDEKQTGKPDTSVPEQTAVDQVKEALSKAETVVEPGVLKKPLSNPFKGSDPDKQPGSVGSDSPEPGGPDATPNSGAGANTTEPESSEAKQ